MKSYSPEELKEALKTNKDLLLIDVREPWEHELYNIGGELIPVDTLLRSPSITKDLPVVLYCEKGIRSAVAVQRLTSAGYTNLINLSGGMYAWKKAFNEKG